MYTSKNLRELKFPENIRSRFSMYIGSAETAHMHLLRETLDNCIDEFLQNYGNVITVEISYKKKFVRISDEGRGIPVDDKKMFKAMFCSTHAGGKFDNKTYSVSAGTNGIGLKAVNALSQELVVLVRRNNRLYYSQFKAGICVQEIEEAEGKLNWSPKTGTSIKFTPELELFGKTELDIDFEELKQLLERISYLNKGLTLTLKNLDIPNEVHTYYSKYGISDYIRHITKDETLICEPLVFNVEDDKRAVEIAMVYTNSQNGVILPFCNSIFNSEGGTHVIGLKIGLGSVIKKYIEDYSLISKKDNIESKDIKDSIRKGLFCVINLKHQNPQYSGQTKLSLVSKDAQGFLLSAMTKVKEIFEEQPTLAKNICRKIIVDAISEKIGRMAKDEFKKDKGTTSLTNTKLSDCTSKIPSECELFICEGNSASGSAKQARDVKTMAVYPLRGKPLNVQDSLLSKVYDNKELSDLVRILGTGIGDNFNLSKLRYHKIIILADSDQDGIHISLLLLTFFYKFFRELIEHGHIYIANSPLYSIVLKSQRYYIKDDVEKEKFIKKYHLSESNVTFSRFKGLGEMDPKMLKETTLDPKTRELTKVTINDVEIASKTLQNFMSSHSASIEFRQKFILKNSNNATNIDSL